MQTGYAENILQADFVENILQTYNVQNIRQADYVNSLSKMGLFSGTVLIIRKRVILQFG